VNFLSLHFTGGKRFPSSILPEISEALNLVRSLATSAEEKVAAFSPARLPSATQMFQIPALITLTIAATRIYRSLLHFSSDKYDLGHEA
jgi:hypothetical protein